MKFKSICCIVLICAILVSLNGIVQGQALYWINTSGTPSPYFDVAGNWSPSSIPSSSDTLFFTQAAEYEVRWDSATASTVPTVSWLGIADGDVDFVNTNPTQRHQLNVTGTFEVHGGADFSISGLQVDAGYAQVLSSMQITGHPSVGTEFTAQSFVIGYEGYVRLTGAALLGSGSASIFDNYNSVIVDQDSTIEFRDITLAEDSLLSIYGGSTVNATDRLDIGSNYYTEGPATTFVSGTGSTLSANFTRVGSTGIVGIASGGMVNVYNEATFDSFVLNVGGGGEGEVIVSGTNSIVEADFLTVGGDESGRIEVRAGGQLVANTFSSIQPNGEIVLNGGSFDFTSLNVGEYGRLSGNSGIVTGVVNNGTTDYADAQQLQTVFDDSGIEVRNSGVLFGSTVTQASLLNRAGGEIQTFTGEQMRFFGATGINEAFAEINNFGGLVHFDGSLINEADGFIGGQGTFIANGGMNNSGVLAFTGNSNILGDLTMSAVGQLVTSGFATTTIFDDLIHNGLEVRTSAGSALTILGAATGAGDYTGTGTVFFEGDLRPGNSPDIVNFEGDVVLGSFADTFIELGGESPGLFDQLLINGSLDLNGDLSVSLIDGFELGNGMLFLVAEVDGDLFGQFNGLGEGDVVGIYDDLPLQISYQAGDGNDIGLYVASLPVVVFPDELTIIRGTQISGGLAELSTSDDSDLTVHREPTDIQSRTEFEVTSSANSANPTFMSITVEGSVFARTTVIQEINVYNFETDLFETVDSRNASQFTDSSTTFELTGNLSRYVEDGTNVIKARVVYRSLTSRQQFTSNTDLMTWSIAD